jgi:hypothetical protein
METETKALALGPLSFLLQVSQMKSRLGRGDAEPKKVGEGLPHTSSPVLTTIAFKSQIPHPVADGPSVKTTFFLCLPWKAVLLLAAVISCFLEENVPQISRYTCVRAYTTQ